MSVANFKSCRSCFERRPGCHDKCDSYKREKEEYEKQKELIKKNKTIVINANDYEKTVQPFSKLPINKRIRKH